MRIIHTLLLILAQTALSYWMAFTVGMLGFSPTQTAGMQAYTIFAYLTIALGIIGALQTIVSIAKKRERAFSKVLLTSWIGTAVLTMVWAVAWGM